MVTLMIAPAPRSAIDGAGRPTRKKGAFTLTPNTASKSASVIPSVGPGG
jgi:hypothetical protein